MLTCGHLVFNVAVDISLSFDNTALAHYGTGAIDAAAWAHVHLDEHMVHRFYILQNVGDTVNTVHRHISVTIGQGIERPDDALGGRIGFGSVGHRGLIAHRKFVYRIEVDTVLLQKLQKLIEGDDGINGMFIGLALLSDTGTDKDQLEVRVVAAQHLCMCHHGRVDRGQIRQCLGIIHLYQTAGCRTGRGDEVAHFTFCQHTFVFFCNSLCSHGCLFSKGKAELGQCYAQDGEIILTQTTYK